MNSVPQTAATTFAISSVCFLSYASPKPSPTNGILSPQLGQLCSELTSEIPHFRFQHFDPQSKILGGVDISLSLSQSQKSYALLYTFYFYWLNCSKHNLIQAHLEVIHNNPFSSLFFISISKNIKIVLLNNRHLRKYFKMFQMFRQK